MENCTNFDFLTAKCQLQLNGQISFFDENNKIYQTGEAGAG